MRSAIASWARDEGQPAGMVSLLASVAPSVAREWAIRRGVPDDVVERPSGERIRAGAYSNTAGMDADLLDSISAVMARQGHRDDERELLEAEIVDDQSPEGAGINDTRMLILGDGSYGFFKSFAGLDDDIASEYGQDRPVQPIHEAAAWQIARELGPEYERLVPTTVLRSVAGKLGSLSRGVDGQPQAPLDVPAEDLKHAGFFDALIGQQDRHGGNLLVDGDELHLIDHGFSFANPRDFLNKSMIQAWRYRDSPAITSGERVTLKRLLDSRDLHGMQEILEGDRSTALRDRAQRMLDTGMVHEPGDLVA